MYLKEVHFPNFVDITTGCLVHDRGFGINYYFRQLLRSLVKLCSLYIIVRYR